MNDLKHLFLCINSRSKKGAKGAKQRAAKDEVIYMLSVRGIGWSKGLKFLLTCLLCRTHPSEQCPPSSCSAKRTGTDCARSSLIGRTWRSQKFLESRYVQHSDPWYETNGGWYLLYLMKTKRVRLCMFFYLGSSGVLWLTRTSSLTCNGHTSRRSNIS